APVDRLAPVAAAARPARGAGAQGGARGVLLPRRRARRGLARDGAGARPRGVGGAAGDGSGVASTAGVHRATAPGEGAAGAPPERQARMTMTPTAARTIEVPVHGMDCAACAGHVRDAIAALPGVETVDVLLSSERAVIRCDP